ncbi:hypothetical protein DVY51_14600 [Enterococcus faecalis]|uniref:hypothetical protein n=1 Tax=Enterococcus faecalis TaxID=1351 RepID=UPI0010C0C53B|nr:hypothetical protein [Enterococcus faecalis]TKP09313.1 hypothetical protein DVY51_14600 [Enterococcus faecalis]
MSESMGIILGAVIALIGTIVTNNFMMKKTRLQEEKISDRFLKKLKAEEEIEVASRIMCKWKIHSVNYS